MAYRDADGKLYEWASPLAWLVDKAAEKQAEGDAQWLFQTLRHVAAYHNGEMLAEIFQREMSDDGYFDPIEEVEDKEGEDDG